MANSTGSRNDTYSAAHFALAIHGIDDIGIFRSIEGGNVKADVMTYQSGPIYDVWRQLGKPHFEDIKLQIGMAMAKPFFEWIKSFFTGKTDRKDGAIIAADFHYLERARRVFTNAMIKELTFPKLDAADKNAAYLGIGMSIEGMTFIAGDNHNIMGDAKAGWQESKLWTACNFRFWIHTMDQPCARVSKVDSFTIKMNVIEYHAGGHRAPIKTPSQIDYPQISFYVPEADAQPFYDVVNDKIGKTVVDPPAQLQATLEVFDNQNEPLFYLEFVNVQIVAVTPDKSESSGEDIKQVKVDLFMESMLFKSENIPV